MPEWVIELSLNSISIRIMNKTILKTPLGNSEIIIEEHGLGLVNQWMKEKHPTSRMVIITDTNIGDIYKDKLVELFPEAQILSVAAGDPDGLPDPATLEALQGYNLLRTDRNGWIELSTDGNQMWVEVGRK